MGEGKESYTHSLDAKGLIDDLFEILMDGLYKLRDLSRLIDNDHPALDGRDQLPPNLPYR